METRLVRVKDLSDSDEQAWRRLADRAAEPNPFFEPDFLIPSCRHVEASEEATLVIAQEKTEFRGVLPILRIEGARNLPVLAGHPRGLWTGSGLSTPLVDPVQAD